MATFSDDQDLIEALLHLVRNALGPHVVLFLGLVEGHCSLGPGLGGEPLAQALGGVWGVALADKDAVLRAWCLSLTPVGPGHHGAIFSDEPLPDLCVDIGLVDGLFRHGSNVAVLWDTVETDDGVHMEVVGLVVPVVEHVAQVLHVLHDGMTEARHSRFPCCSQCTATDELVDLLVGLGLALFDDTLVGWTFECLRVVFAWVACRLPGVLRAHPSL